MKLYNYHSATKEFTYESEAKLDPLETEIQKKNVYLIPNNATTIAPPEPKEGYARVWMVSSWQYIVDKRGKKVWNTVTEREEEITVLGDIDLTGNIIPIEKRPVSKEEVKKEARDRIIGFAPDYKQRNMQAEIVEFIMRYGTETDLWPIDAQERYSSIMVISNMINHIRRKSNEIEELDPIPYDYRDNKYWE